MFVNRIFRSSLAPRSVTSFLDNFNSASYPRPSCRGASPFGSVLPNRKLSQLCPCCLLVFPCYRRPGWGCPLYLTGTGLAPQLTVAHPPAIPRGNCTISRTTTPANYKPTGLKTDDGLLTSKKTDTTPVTFFFISSHSLTSMTFITDSSIRSFTRFLCRTPDLQAFPFLYDL